MNSSCELTVTRPYLGFGLGLRAAYYDEIINEKPPLDWFEITSENYLIPGGKHLDYLDKVRALYPIVMHGVSLSLGNSEDLDKNYLKQLKNLATSIEPAWISDHLCWTGVDGVNTHDLLPMPYTLSAINHIVSRIQEVQDYLGQQIAIENVSSYVTFKQSEMTEWEFIAEIIKQADCYLLLDINNVYVSSINNHFQAWDYIAALPTERIIQIHLAGHCNQGDLIIDTHDAPIIKPVWALYAETIKRYGKISTMIERDDNMPSLIELLSEIKHARALSNQALIERSLL